MLNKRIFVVLILVFLTLFSSCRRKQELSKNTPLQKIQEDEVFEMVAQKESELLELIYNFIKNADDTQDCTCLHALDGAEV